MEDGLGTAEVRGGFLVIVASGIVGAVGRWVCFQCQFYRSECTSRESAESQRVQQMIYSSKDDGLRNPSTELRLGSVSLDKASIGNLPTRIWPHRAVMYQHLNINTILEIVHYRLPPRRRDLNLRPLYY